MKPTAKQMTTELLQSLEQEQKLVVSKIEHYKQRKYEMTTWQFIGRKIILDSIIVRLKEIVDIEDSVEYESDNLDWVKSFDGMAQTEN